MTKSHESKMLAKVRRWREKAHEADKTKSLPERAEELDERARKLGLPVAGLHKTSR